VGSWGAASVVLAAVAAGCGFEPRGAADLDGGDDVDDARGDDASLDSDDDGILDGVDNCPQVPNPAPQRDHDGDGIGDPCDPCPHRNASEGGGDADGDGVGDPCDPRPGQADRISLFEGFYQAPTDWSMTGSWDHDPAGFLRHGTAVTEAAFAMMPRTLTPPYQVEAGVVVDAIASDPGTVARHAGVAFAATEALDGFYLCSVRDDLGAGTPARAVIARFTQIDQSSENTSTNLAADLTPGATFRVRGEDGASQQGCLGTLAGTSGHPVLDATVQPGGRIGVRTFALAVRFDYLVLYQPAM
jgi:hypothetical protein